MRTVLHVGCGQARKAQLPLPLRSDDWREVRFDIDPTAQPDIIGSITDLSMIADATHDALYSSHNIEHLFAHEVPVALREFARVLKPDGVAVITCPDLQALGVALAEGRLVEPLYTAPSGPIAAIDILYGHRASIQAGNSYMAHRVGFTGPVLLATMKDSGFAAVTGIRVPSAFALWAVGFRRPVNEAALAEARQLYLPASANR